MTIQPDSFTGLTVKTKPIQLRLAGPNGIQASEGSLVTAIGLRNTPGSKTKLNLAEGAAI